MEKVNYQLLAFFEECETPKEMEMAIKGALIGGEVDINCVIDTLIQAYLDEKKFIATFEEELAEVEEDYY